MSTRSRSSNSARLSYPERPKAPANSSRRFLSREATATSTAFGYSRVVRARLYAEYQWPSPARATRQTRLIGPTALRPSVGERAGKSRGGSEEFAACHGVRVSDVGDEHVVDSLNRLVGIALAPAGGFDRVEPLVSELHGQLERGGEVVPRRIQFDVAVAVGERKHRADAAVLRVLIGEVAEIAVRPRS